MTEKKMKAMITVTLTVTLTVYYFFIYRSFSKISKNNDMLKIEIKYFISYLVQRKNLLYFYEERKKKTIKFQ